MAKNTKPGIKKKGLGGKPYEIGRGGSRTSATSGSGSRANSGTKVTSVVTKQGVKSIKKDIKAIKKVKSKITKPIKTIKKAYRISEKDRLNMVAKSNPQMNGLEIQAWAKHPGYASSLSNRRLVNKNKWSGPTIIKVGKIMDAKRLIKTTKKLNLPKKGKK